jgi:hypothetical protein
MFSDNLEKQGQIRKFKEAQDRISRVVKPPATDSPDAKDAKKGTMGVKRRQAGKPVAGVGKDGKVSRSRDQSMISDGKDPKKVLA